MILQDEFKSNGYLNLLDSANIIDDEINLEDLFDIDDKPVELLGIYISQNRDELFFVLDGNIMDINELCDTSEIFVIHILWNLSKQQVEILEGIYPVCFCSFNQAVQERACLCTVGRFDHYKVLSANGKRPDCLFGIVVIHGNMPIR